MKFLRNNLGLKIFCLLLSIFLWAWVRFTETPMAEKNESQTSISIPIAYENKRDDLIVTRNPDKVILTVKGPPKVIDNIRPDHFKAIVNLQDKGEGQYWADIGVKNPPGLTVSDVQPTRANVVLEKLEKIKFPVRLILKGVPKEGYTVGTPLFEPDVVEVQSPHSMLKSINEVEVSLDVTGADRDLRQRVQPEPVDRDGRFIPAKVSPEYVRVALPVRSRIMVSTLPIAPVVTGTPESGYRVVKIITEPPVATVVLQEKISAAARGQESPLRSRSLLTEAVDISGEKNMVKKQVNIIEPEGLSLVSQKQVMVRIIIRKEDS